MKKLIALFCLFALLVTPLAGCKKPPEEPPTPPTEAELYTPADTTVSYVVPALPAVAGKRLDLHAFTVYLTEGNAVKGDKITWSSETLTLDEGRYVTPEAAGTYAVKATSGKLEKTLYVVAKTENETEFALYREDFSNAKLADFRVIEKKDAEVYLQNGKLVLDAMKTSSSNARVLLPEFLWSFGNYRITAEIKMTNAENSGRWTSLMFRVQEESHPYYQMAVRRDASLSNGTELAVRTEEDKWDVRHTGVFSESLAADKAYTLTIEVRDGFAAAFVNGAYVASGADFTEYLRGDIGFQANRCRVEVDAVTVSLLSEQRGSTLSAVESGILGATAVLTEITTAEMLANVAKAPATGAVLRLNAALEVIGADGAVLADLEGALAHLGEGVLPVFAPADAAGATALAGRLLELRLYDAMVLSASAEVLNAVHAACPLLGGVLDLRALTPDKTDPMGQLTAIREETNAANSRVCLLSADFADKGAVQYLAGRATTVWLEAKAPDTVSHITALTAGAHGVLTSDTAALARDMGSAYFAKNSMLRPVEIIGHRGMPSAGPENTLESSRLAVAAGAKIVENDIYLTKDGVLVVMHDGTIDRTTNGTGKVESMTLAELRQYKVDVPAGSAAQIPTLEDYFIEFGGTDVVLFIEIKSEKAELVPALASLIAQYDILDQCAVITFDEAQAHRVRTQIPGISCGYLTGKTDMASVLLDARKWDATYNPNYSKLTGETVAALALRGITVWPYTLNKQADFDRCFRMGPGGITTNYASYASAYLRTLDADAAAYAVTVGGSTVVTLTTTAYNGSVSAAEGVEMIRLAGNESVRYENGSLTATAAGSATVMFRVSFRQADGATVYVYTQPTVVTVS